MTSKTKLIILVIALLMLLYASIIGEGSAFNLLIIVIFIAGIKNYIDTRAEEKKEK